MKHNDIDIYTIDTCPFCRKAKELLRDNYLEYVEHNITNDEQKQREFLGKKFAINGRVTVPQIIINGTHIGGYSELKNIVNEGKLCDYLRCDYP